MLTFNMKEGGHEEKWTMKALGNIGKLNADFQHDARKDKKIYFK